VWLGLDWPTESEAAGEGEARAEKMKGIRNTRQKEAAARTELPPTTMAMARDGAVMAEAAAVRRGDPTPPVLRPRGYWLPDAGAPGSTCPCVNFEINFSSGAISVFVTRSNSLMK